MTPQEKAKELYNKMYWAIDYKEHDEQRTAFAKGCAIITVEEHIKQLEELNKPEYSIYVTSHEPIQTMNGYEKMEYWEEVKSEISNA